MKRYVVFFLTMILSVSMAQIWAKDGKIKYGKYILYEGSITKLDGEKLPSGEGVLYIKGIDKKEQDVVTVTGSFEGGNVSNAVVRLGAVATFEGKIHIEIQEAKVQETAKLIFIEGVVRVPSEERPIDIKYSLIPSDAEIYYEYKQKTVSVRWPNWSSVYQRDAAYSDYDIKGRVTYLGNLTFIQKKGAYEFVGIPVYGKITDKDRNTFTGDLENGNSKGKLTYSKGGWAEGTFDSHLSVGFNYWTFLAGDCEIDVEGGHYKGSIEDKKYSNGILSLRDGGRYEGTWKNGAFCNGVSSGNFDYSKYNDNNRYQGIFNGIWVDGEFVKGTCSSEKMKGYYFSHYEGSVSQDTLLGNFIYDSCILNGSLVAKKINGRCVIVNKNERDSIVGDWENGVCKTGTFSVFHNGNVYSGTIENNKYTFNIDGQQYSAKVKNTIEDQILNRVFTEIVPKMIIRGLNSLSKPIANKYLVGHTYSGTIDPKVVFGNSQFVADYMNKMGKMCVDLRFDSDEKVHDHFYLDISKREKKHNSMDLYGYLSMGSSYNPQTMDFLWSLIAVNAASGINEETDYDYYIRGDSIFVLNTDSIPVKISMRMYLSPDHTQLRSKEAYGDIEFFRTN